MVFVASGVGKMLDLPAFSIAVEEFHILPLPLVLPFSIAVPIIEVTLGLAFVAGIFLRHASFGLAALLVSFLIAIGINLVKGNPIPCGCAGVLGGDKVSLNLFFIDLGLLLSIFLVLYFPHSKATNDERFFSLNKSPLKAIASYTFLKGDEFETGTESPTPIVLCGKRK